MESSGQSQRKMTPSVVPSRNTHKENLPDQAISDADKKITLKAEVKTRINKKFKRFNKGGANSTTQKIQILHQDELTELEGSSESAVEKPKTKMEYFNQVRQSEERSDSKVLYRRPT